MKSVRCSAIYLLLGVLLFPAFSWGQKPAMQRNYAMFRQEAYGGLNFNTNGWGGSFYYSKHRTAFLKTLYTADLSFIKHPKEYKIFNPLDENSKSYVFGKMNSFATLDLGYGRKKIFYEKLREKGVQVSVNWTVGPSIGFVKPVYLEILKFNGIEVVGIAEEKYDPESHNLTNIYGRAPNTRGISEMKFAFGAFLKTGINFEFSPVREGIKAVELGGKLSVYPQRVPIMANIDNKFLFTELYISLQVGKKYI